MRIISLWEPWATLWAGGKKRIETRHWFPKFALPEVIAVHAAKKFTMEQRMLCLTEPFKSALAELKITCPDQFKLGCVIGVVRMIRIYQFSDSVPLPPEPERSFGDFTFGRYGWLTDCNRLLSTPIPEKGHQKFWEWTPPEGTHS